MSIEQKIAEILAESTGTAAEDSIVAEAATAEQNPDNAKNDVDTQPVGVDSKAKNKVTADASEPEESDLDDVTDGVTEVKEDASVEHAPSMKEDIDALVSGEDLTEEFKEKAATIFEAAVLSRVKQEVAYLDEAYAVKLAEQVEEIKEGLVEKVDGYLDYVVEQWMEQNEIALESGMKSEILEGFVGGLKSLFEEHYIDVPEEKFDVLGALEEEIEDLRNKLDEQVASNVDMKAKLNEQVIAQLVDDLCEGLVETDKEKFLGLIESLDFDGVESFEKKARTIRESYFTNKVTAQPVVESVVTDAPVNLQEEAVRASVTPQMQNYLSVLDNLK